MESGGAIRWLRMRLVWGKRNPVRRTSPSTCRLLTLVGLGVSLGGFRAENRTVLGKAQAPRVEASQGFYSSGFIQTNKQTNKTSKAHPNPNWGKTIYQIVDLNLKTQLLV